MNLSRGTGFVELYIKTEHLSSNDWDVMADGLKWAHQVFPFFKNPKMHGETQIVWRCMATVDGVNKEDIFLSITLIRIINRFIICLLTEK